MNGTELSAHLSTLPGWTMALTPLKRRR